MPAQEAEAQLAELAALLHDVADHKYRQAWRAAGCTHLHVARCHCRCFALCTISWSIPPPAAPAAALSALPGRPACPVAAVRQAYATALCCSCDPDGDRARLAAFLADGLGLSTAEQGAVLHVIDSMGFNAELARQQAAQQAQQQAQQAEGVQQGEQPQSRQQWAEVAAWEAARQRVLAVVQVGLTRGTRAGGVCLLARQLGRSAPWVKGALCHKQAQQAGGR